jgi:hypothetical protein
MKGGAMVNACNIAIYREQMALSGFAACPPIARINTPRGQATGSLAVDGPLGSLLNKIKRGAVFFPS